MTLSNTKLLAILSTICLFSASPIVGHAGETLNDDQLKALLVGNFLKVDYTYSGDQIHMWEFYQKDGSITGGSDEFGPYSASYTIKNGEICPDYAEGFEAYEGCYSYQHISGNQYKLVNITWPENPSVLNVTIVKGLQGNLQNN